MSVSEELEKIREANNGILYPQSVVDFARDPSTELHSKFEWDNTVAGENFRIWQARKVIRALVTIIPHKNNEPFEVQTYVSMSVDRHRGEEKNENIGGYRYMIDVLSTPDLRESLLSDALAEFELWERKYKIITELAEVFAAAKTVKQKTALVPITVRA
jgi:hypothetical protein